MLPKVYNYYHSAVLCVNECKTKCPDYRQGGGKECLFSLSGHLSMCHHVHTMVTWYRQKGELCSKCHNCLFSV